MAYKALTASVNFLNSGTIFPVIRSVVAAPASLLFLRHVTHTYLTTFTIMFSLPAVIFPHIAAWLTPSIDLGFHPEMSHCQQSPLWLSFAVSHSPC